MLNLFSKQFELLTRTIDDFESNMAKILDGKTVSPPATSAVEETFKKLAMQILSLEGKIDTQSSRIADIEHDLATMSQENKMLREEMQKLVKNTVAIIEEKNQHFNLNSGNSEDDVNESRVMVSLRDQRNFIQPGQTASPNCVSVPTRGGSGYCQNKEESSTRTEGIELIVTGIVDSLRAEIDPVEVAHVVLSTVLPSLNKEDITSVRQATAPAVRGRTSRVDAENSTDAPGAELRPLPLIVRFANKSKVDEVLNSKSSFTRLNTSDIEHTRLSEKLQKSIT